MIELRCYVIFLVLIGTGMRVEVTCERLFVQKSTLNEFLNNQEHLTDDYIALLSDFATEHFEGYHNILVLLSNSCSICHRVLSVLMNASAGSFFTVNDDVVTNYSLVESVTGVIPTLGYYGFIIFFTKDINEFFDQFAKLRLLYAWNPRARHLIFTVEEPDDKELEMIFEECWSCKILNVAVIILNQKGAYTYNPYLKNHSEMREKVENWSRLFYDKLHNMNGCLIRAKYLPFNGLHVVKWIPEEARLKYYGSDYGYAEAFFQTVNATAVLVNLTIDTLPSYRNASFRYKIWKDLTFNGAELWMNYMMFQGKFRVRSEKTYPLRRDNVRILAPKSGLRTPSILDPYNNTTWTCVMLSVLTFALYSCVFYKRRGIDDNAFLRTFGIFLGKNLANRRHELLEKFTFLVFTMASMLILSAYQGALYGALATVSHHPEIDTILQLSKRIKTIYTHRIIVDLVQGYVPGIEMVAFNTGTHYQYMKTHRNQAYAFANNNAQYTAKLKILSENGIPFYHIMNDYSFPAFVSHTLPYGSPYLTKLNRVLLICNEAGLDQYWDAEARLNAVLSGTIIPDVVEEKPLKKLTLETQLIGFYIWGSGLLIGTFCFFAENYYHKYGEEILAKF